MTSQHPGKTREMKCPACGAISAGVASACAKCGKAFPAGGASSPILLSSGPASASPPCLSYTMSGEDLDRLWDLIDRLPDPQRHFPGEYHWPDDEEADQAELRIVLPPDCALLSDLDVAQLSNPWQLINDLAGSIDAIHESNVRLNSIGPGSVIVNRDKRAVGFCLPPLLTAIDAPAALVPQLPRADFIAAPEILGTSAYPAGRASDVYLLAALFYALYAHPQDRGPIDLKSAIQHHQQQQGSQLAPSLRACMEEALALQPERRPATAGQFVHRLRVAMLADLGQTHLSLSASGRTDIGLGGRTSNQDAFALRVDSTGDGNGVRLTALLAVADGMGGGHAGERASAFCINRLLAATTNDLAILGDHFASPRLWKDAATTWIKEMNRQAIELGNSLGAGGNFGSTLTGLLIVGDRALLIHSGDTRCFRLRDGQMRLLALPQSLAWELHRRGQLTRSQVDRADSKHELLGYIGAPGLEPQVELLDVQPGDVYLLCSDGLIEGLSEREIAQVLTETAPDQAAGRLIALSKAAQSAAQPAEVAAGEGLYSDNMTAVVARISETGQH